MTHRTNVSFDADTKRLLDQFEVNASELFRLAVRGYANGATGETAILVELERRQLEQERDRIRQSIDDARERLDMIDTRLAELEEIDTEPEVSAEQSTFDHWVSIAKRANISPDASNPAVKNYARKAGVTPVEFAEALDQ